MSSRSPTSPGTREFFSVRQCERDDKGVRSSDEPLTIADPSHSELSCSCTGDRTLPLLAQDVRLPQIVAIASMPP